MREEEKNTSRGFKRYFKKRWVFPAAYIASAALILTGVLWYQNSSTDNAIDSDKFSMNGTNAPGQNAKDEAIEVSRAMENVKLPLTAKDSSSVVIQKKFYEDNAKAEEQEAALVVYQNQYHPNTGIDITVKDGEAFDVMASLSGTVTRVEEDALLGNVIEIQHNDDIVVQYSSVKGMKVEVGDEIEQGQAIATAGQSLFNEEAGTHVHFEIRKNGVPVNPEKFLNKPVSELQESTVTEEPAAEEQTTGDNGVSEEEELTNEEGKEEMKKEPAADKESSDATEGQDSTEKPADTDKSTEEKPADEKESTDSEKPADEKNADQKQEKESTNKTNQDA
ncbi:peptidoglycan DD-metalloendopeptidase family protein [Niallia oryzisoli]|uniref:peptidoglycan DD-metalloendopeptidase family protein n=1 Tax=Niallia oryzisoli TaxID=1737571 RepID=UPI003734D403